MGARRVNNFCESELVESGRVHVTDTFVSGFGMQLSNQKFRTGTETTTDDSADNPTVVSPSPRRVAITDTCPRYVKCEERELQSEREPTKKTSFGQRGPYCTDPGQIARKRLSHADLNDELHVLINWPCRSRCRICVRCRHILPEARWVSMPREQSNTPNSADRKTRKQV